MYNTQGVFFPGFEVYTHIHTRTHTRTYIPLGSGSIAVKVTLSLVDAHNSVVCVGRNKETLCYTTEQWQVGMFHYWCHNEMSLYRCSCFVVGCDKLGGTR